MEEDLGVKKIIMVEKQEDRFDLRNFLDFWSRPDYLSNDILWAQIE